MEKKVVKSPIHWIGSKLFLIDKFRYDLYFPARYAEPHPYIELFCGSAIMMYNIQPKWAILNDLDHRIYNFFHVLRHKRSELESTLQYVWVGKDWMNEFSECTDDVGKAVYFYLDNINRTGFINKPKLFPKTFDVWAKIMDQSRLELWNKSYEEALTLLNKGIMWSGTASENRATIFEDPPYFDTEDVYKMHFDETDHRKLAVLNHVSPHRIIVSYQDTPLVRELYSDWYCKEFPYINRMSKKSHIELLLSNEPLVRRGVSNISSFL